MTIINNLMTMKMKIGTTTKIGSLITLFFLVFTLSQSYGQLSITAEGAAETIDFNATKPGVNESPFDGSGFASSPSVWRGTIRNKAIYRINAGLKRSFLKEKLLVQVSVNDIFNTGSVYYFSSDYGGMVFDGNVFFDSRRVAVNVSYKFGNQEIKTRKSKSSLDKELNRISD